MAASAETQVVVRLTYNFRIRVDGLLTAYASAVQKPKVEKALVEHSSGGAKYNTKQLGKISVDNLVIEKAKPANEGDSWAWDWFLEESSFDGQGTALGARRTVVVEELAADAEIVVDRWTYKECLVLSVEDSKNDALQPGERMVETVTIAVNRVDR